jgi:hypothetical protein
LAIIKACGRSVLFPAYLFPFVSFLFLSPSIHSGSHVQGLALSQLLDISSVTELS